MDFRSNGMTRRQLMLSTAAITGVQAIIAIPAAGLSPQGTAACAETEAFRNPPPSARPWVYWCWLDSNVTQASITLDLEAMRDVGIGGVLLLDVFQGTPKGPMRFMDAQWQSAFRHTVRECDRLGLEIIFNNGAGYYGSGGPWVPPEKGLQTVVASETHITGGKAVKLTLPRPHVATDGPLPPGWWELSAERLTYPAGRDYRDISVIAVKEPAYLWQSMTDGTPPDVVPSLPNTSVPAELNGRDGAAFTFTFAAKRKIGVADLALKEVLGSWQIAVDVQAGAARDWTPCAQIGIDGANAWKTASMVFEAVEARTFRVRLAGGADARASLVGIELHARYRVPDPTGMKGLHWWEWNDYTGVTSAPPDARAPAGAAIPLEDVIDVSARMAPDGAFEWEAPEGNWTIMRIGHAFKGRTVGPGRVDVIGPETDKLDRDATRLHFNAMVRPLAEFAVRERARSLIATHIDSWEGGGQNWTAQMRDTFRARRGYDPARFLPALVSGRIIGDLQQSERFLWDVRQTVSELVTENYWGEFQRLANASGLKLSAQTYTTTGQDLDAAARTDLPIAEFWNKTYDGFAHTARTMSSAAHLNGQTIVAAEAFTANDSERWLDHPAHLKAQGDAMLAQGINRFVFHRYAAQRFGNVYPGLQMGPWGLHYERTNTWWRFSGPWHLYLTRAQYMLRRGRPVKDILYLQSEEPLLRVKSHTVNGYDYDICGPDMFRTVECRDQELAFPSGATYKLLVLDHNGTTTLETLRRTDRLVQDGARILGVPPVATPGLSDYPRADRDLIQLAAKLWNAPGGQHGAGRVFSAMTEQAALQSLDVLPAFDCAHTLNWTWRKDRGADIVFVANPSASATLVTAAFRTGNRHCSLWDAEDGSIAAATSATAMADGRMKVTFPLSASGSVFVVFTPAPIAAGAAPSPAIAARDAARLPVEGPWHIRFTPVSGPARDVTADKLFSWPDHGNEDIRHFSGTATYSTRFEAGPRIVASGRAMLDLGAVEVMARVRLNGRDLGVLWRPPYRVDVTGHLKPGRNSLQIEVVNLWVNRLIGDDALPEDSERYDDGTRRPGVNNGTLKAWPQWLLDGRPSPAGRQTFVSWRLWRKDEALLPSGLIGPVSLSVTGWPA